MPSTSVCGATHSRCVLVCASLLGLSVARHLPNTFQEDFETTPDLIVQHGYPMEIHTLASEDGYLLTLHRIPFSGRVRYSSDSQSKRAAHSKEYRKQWQRYGTDARHRDKSASSKPIVFLQHGVFASSLDWVLTGPDNALGYRMSDAGYDVWMGNLRGNIYSSQHVNMSRKDSQFWNFSWHEIGIYDLPAMIDYVLSVTNQPTLHFIGHSMGATTAVVMLSEKPHYNAKLDLTILLAPVVKLQHNTSILRYSAPFWKAFQRITGYSGMFGFPPTPERLQRRLQPVCAEQLIGSGFCARILDTVAGYARHLNQTLLPILFGHYPTQTSTRTMAHFMQGMHTGNFSKFDYGPDENMLRYNQTLPLEYDLAKITSPTAIFYGDSDPFTDLKTLAVLNPFRATDASILQDNDLAGPLVFCLIFGGLLLLSGKVHFSYIYGIGVLGCLAVYALLTLMAATSVTLGNVVSVLGYCLLPMVALSAVNIILSLQGLIGVILTGLSICWCSLSASKLFVTALAMDHQQPLIAYPCALLYGVFALITIF